MVIMVVMATELMVMVKKEMLKTFMMGDKVSEKCL